MEPALRRAWRRLPVDLASLAAAPSRSGGYRPPVVVLAGGRSGARRISHLSGESRPSGAGPPTYTASLTTSDQTRRPAEFKHITKRRKRN